MKAISDKANDVQLTGPGRGSAAGSLVAYVLYITNVDPIEYGLLFERFLSPDRTDLPDIDTDVGDRDKLLEMMRDEYGNENLKKGGKLFDKAVRQYGGEVHCVNRQVINFINFLILKCIERIFRY